MITLETLSIIISTIALLAGMAGFIFFTIERTKKNRELLKQSKAELSYMREYFESKIYELNDQLMSNNERWKEVNHLLLNYNPTLNNDYVKPIKPVLSNFFKEIGINENDIELDRKLVFVLTPFHEDKQSVYEVIYNSCSKIGLKCQRGDEEFIGGNVFRYILEKMLSARLIIANIDGRNPNVMYELGIAHAIGKPTILISHHLSEIPFDVKAHHIIIYKNFEALSLKISDTLTRLLVSQN